MNIRMANLGITESQILGAIICFVTINMMDNLRLGERASQGRFHYHAMFADIAASIGRGVRRLKEKLIPASNNNAAAPLGVSVPHFGTMRATNPRRANRLSTIGARMLMGELPLRRIGPGLPWVGRTPAAMIFRSAGATH